MQQQSVLQFPVRLCDGPPRRSGMVLITILVAIALIGTFLSLGLRLLVTQRTHLRRESMYLQATVLAESASQRAKLQLNKNPQFSGEIWKIPQEELPGGGVVEIDVGPIAEQPDQRRISIQVNYPDDSSGVSIEKTVFVKGIAPRSEGEK